MDKNAYYAIQAIEEHLKISHICWSYMEWPSNLHTLVPPELPDMILLVMNWWFLLMDLNGSYSNLAPELAKDPPHLGDQLEIGFQWEADDNPSTTQNNVNDVHWICSIDRVG